MAELRAAAAPVSFILVSHFLEELERTCDRAIVLRNGEVAGVIPSRPVAVGDVASMMAGGRAREEGSKPRPARLSTTPILGVSGVVVDDGAPVSFEAYPGEVIGLAGLVGSGRTEVLRAIGLGRVVSGARSPSTAYRSSTRATPFGQAFSCFPKIARRA